MQRFFCVPPCAQALEQRQRSRLKEAGSTVAKRLAWAKAQCARPAEAKAAFDHVVANVDARDEVTED